MKESSLRVLRGVGDFLDHPLIRWAGSIGTLLWIAPLIAGLLGRIFDSGYEAGANILIVIGALGLLLQLLGTFLPRSTTGDDRAADRPRNDIGDDGELKTAIEVELVALIDEWKALRPSEFEETANAPYSFLLGRTREFLETILGRAEAQRFEDNGSEKPRTFNQLVDLRIRALSLLRDSADRWHPRVDLDGLGAAVAARKEIDYGSAILIAGSPLDSHYEIPADPDSFDSPSWSEETDGEVEEEKAAVAVLAPEGNLKSALRTERAEGAKLLQALKGGLLQSFLYDRVPTNDDVHGWQANVEHLLHTETELLQLFRWQPLTQTVGLSWASVADALQGGPEIRRLEGLLAQLDKVIERLSR